MSKKHHGGTPSPVINANMAGATAQKYQNYFFFIPAASSLLAIAALILWGLHAGIDLKGGSLLQVKYPAGRPDQAALQTKINALNFGEVRIQPSNENEYILRQRDLTNAEKNTLNETVNSFGKAEEVARLVVFLAAEESAFITGADFAINGGQHMF